MAGFSKETSDPLSTARYISAPEIGCCLSTYSIIGYRCWCHPRITLSESGIAGGKLFTRKGHLFW